MKDRLTCPFRSGGIVQLQSIDRVAASRIGQSDIMDHTPSSGVNSAFLSKLYKSPDQVGEKEAAH